MLAQIASAAINFGGRGAKRWFEPRDLMPGETKPVERLTAAQKNQRVRDALRGLMGAGRGSR